MLRIRLEINEREIGVIGALNTQTYRTKDVSNIVEHLYEIYDIREWDETEESIMECRKLGYIWHNREAGASKLTEKIMSKVGEHPLEEEENELN